MQKKFVELVNEHFQFLVTQYRFEGPEFEHGPLYCNALYKRPDIHVQINFDERDCWVTPFLIVPERSSGRMGVYDYLRENKIAAPQYNPYTSTTSDPLARELLNSSEKLIFYGPYIFT